MLGHLTYYQDHEVEEFDDKEADNLGMTGSWDHHKIDEKEINRDQNIIGARIQFSGLKCGIEAHSLLE